MPKPDPALLDDADMILCCAANVWTAATTGGGPRHGSLKENLSRLDSWVERLDGTECGQFAFEIRDVLLREIRRWEAKPCCCPCHLPREAYPAPTAQPQTAETAP